MRSLTIGHVLLLVALALVPVLDFFLRRVQRRLARPTEPPPDLRGQLPTAAPVPVWTLSVAAPFEPRPDPPPRRRRPAAQAIPPVLPHRRAWDVRQAIVAMTVFGSCPGLQPLVFEREQGRPTPPR